MKQVIVSLAVASGLLMAGQASADEALAKGKNCMACHAIDKKLVGPSFKEVAAKYKDDKEAAGKLAKKVKAGGSGVWGAIPMPPNNITDDESAKLVKWVLSHNK